MFENTALAAANIGLGSTDADNRENTQAVGEALGSREYADCVSNVQHQYEAAARLGETDAGTLPPAGAVGPLVGLPRRAEEVGGCHARPGGKREAVMRGDFATSEQVWDAHTAAEFVTSDVEATMATMTDNPTVLHVSTSVGARGRDAVRRFYSEYFIGHQASDMRLDLTSRTATAERLVDEMTVSFTHDVEIPWILPGIPPTGRSVTVPIVAVITFVDGLVDSEHIYWDQATVLAQIGLLDPTGLPVTGAEQAALVAADADPGAFRVMAAAPPAD